MATSELRRYIEKNLITIDIETWGVEKQHLLQSWQVKFGKSGVLCIGCKHSDTVFGYSYESLNSDSKINIGEGVIVGGWNLKFDVGFLKAKNTIAIYKGAFFLDGMLLLKRMFPNRNSYGLKQVLKDFAKELQIEDAFTYSNDIEFKAGRPEEVYTTEELQKLRTYCQKDAEYTHKLILHLVSIASEEDILGAMRDSTVSVLFAMANIDGIPLDKEFTNHYLFKIQGLINEYLLAFSDLDLHKDIIDSPKKLATFLQGVGITLSMTTDKGETSVCKEALEIARDNAMDESCITLLQGILTYKELNSEATKFLLHALESIDANGRTHPEAFLLSTYTGRLTYSTSQAIELEKVYKNGNTRKTKKKIPIGIPLHQMKRGEIRNIVTSPDGFEILECDYSGQEMRLLACIANEKTMIEFFNEGKDLHAYTASQILGMSYEDFLELQKVDAKKYKEARQVGKVTNLALQYRLGAQGLHNNWLYQHKLKNKTLQDAIHARDTYLRIYNGVPEYWASAIRFSKSFGYTRNLAGKKYPLSFEDSYKDEQTAINYPVQSTGAEQKTLALYSLYPFLMDNLDDIKFAWDLHDGLYFFITEDKEKQKELIKTLKDIVENLNYEGEWNWKPQIKFPVELKIGKSWGNLKIIEG